MDSVQVVNSDIARLKKMKGKSRLWTSSKLSKYLLSQSYTDFPGLAHQFLETKRWRSEEGNWIEHKLLLRHYKLEESQRCLEHMFTNVSRFIGSLGLDNESWTIDQIGLMEVDCSNSSYYYFLIYILSDEDNKVCEVKPSDS